MFFPMEYLPQAYTKDTLVRAFEWLQNQPDKVKDMADNPETLVSLYQKAHGHGVFKPKGSLINSQIDEQAPSSKHFMNELKDLAQDLEEFNTSPPMPSPSKKRIVSNYQPTKETSTNSEVVFDAKTLQMLNQIQTRFNLSSTNEALRMLIAVGYEKISTWTV